MPASPRRRIGFEDGGDPLEVPSNLWVWRDGRYVTSQGRFTLVSLLSVGDTIRPDGPQEKGRVIRKIEILPYKRSKK